MDFWRVEMRRKFLCVLKQHTLINRNQATMSTSQLPFKIKIINKTNKTTNYIKLTCVRFS